MARAATSIQAETRIAGRVEGKGDLDVFGQIEGSIVIDGDLLLDADARIDADVQARKVSLHGIFTGNCKAEFIELFETAIVVGDLRAPKIIVADGARFRGLIDMGEFGPAEAQTRPAPAARRPASRSRRAASSTRTAAKRRAAEPTPEPPAEESEDS